MGNICNKRILIMGIYGPPGGGEDIQNATFFEEEVFEVLDNETYDNVIIAGDWNVFLDTDKDQKNYNFPGKYRTKTREEIKSKMRTHNLSDIYREQNPTKKELRQTTNNKQQLPEYSAFQIFQSMAGLGSLANLEFGN